jgi:hypothetical protein
MRKILSRIARTISGAFEIQRFAQDDTMVLSMTPLGSG